jgi:hypothetical protein
MPATIQGEGVAGRAVGLDPRAESSRRLIGRVLDARLFLVATRAARRLDLAHARFSQAVAAVAGQALLEHMRAVTAHRARHLPGLLHADARRLCAIVRTSRDQRRQ